MGGFRKSLISHKYRAYNSSIQSGDAFLLKEANE